MLRDFKSFKRVILAAGKTDLRRGMDGLKAIIQLKYGLDPLEPGTLFLFCGTRRDRIKGLLFEGDGYLMLTKRLSDGVYQWPRDTDEALSLDYDAFRRLMDGFTVESSIRFPVLSKEQNNTP